MSAINTPSEPTETAAPTSATPAPETNGRCSIGADSKHSAPPSEIDPIEAAERAAIEDVEGDRIARAPAEPGATAATPGVARVVEALTPPGPEWAECMEHVRRVRAAKQTRSIKWSLDRAEKHARTLTDFEAVRAANGNRPAPIEFALEHLRDGIAVLPVGYREKGPRFKRWPEFRTTEQTIREAFDRDLMNNGCVLGTASGGLVDDDLDCVEAVALAPLFLSQTRTFGRASKPRSHYLSRAPDLGEQRTKQFRDPMRTVLATLARSRGQEKSGDCLVELRANGGHTVLPGSTHMSGEWIDWTDPKQPISQYPYADLRAAVGRLAAACLVVRYFPDATDSSRHDEARRALVTGLRAADWSDERIRAFLAPIAQARNFDPVLTGDPVPKPWERVVSLLVDGRLSATDWQEVATIDMADPAGDEGTKYETRTRQKFVGCLLEWFNIEAPPSSVNDSNRHTKTTESPGPSADGSSPERESEELQRIPIEARRKRARAYIKRMPIAVETANGSGAALKVAIVLTRGFALGEAVAFEVFSDDYNLRCRPPWSEAEIKHKIEDGMKGSMPWGAKVRSRRTETGHNVTPEQREAAKKATEAEVAKFNDDTPKKGEEEIVPLVTQAGRVILTACFQGALSTGEAQAALGAVRTKSGLSGKLFAQTIEKCRDDLRARLPPAEACKLSAAVPVAHFVGDPGLRLPPGYRVDAEHALVRVSSSVGEVGNAEESIRVVAHQAFWVFEELRTPEGVYLHLAALVRGGCVQFMLPRSILADSRALHGALEGRGIAIPKEKKVVESIPGYVSSFRQQNETRIPLRVARLTTGWDADYKSFLLGNECIGGLPTERVFELEDDDAARRFCAAIGVKGDAKVWRQTITEMLTAASLTGLMISASVASPMLELFGWVVISILLGDLGGRGKSSELRAAGSVYGATGSSSSRQAGGIVGVGGGTPKGLLLEFRRLAGLPHLCEELKVDLTDNRKKEELANVLHQLSEGREHVRAKRDSRGSQIGWSFLACVVVVGEVDAEEFLRKGGVLRRYLTPHGPYGTVRLGVFVERLATNYGHLGRALVQGLVDASAEKRRSLAALLEPARTQAEAVVDKVCPDRRDDETIRTWTQQIAVALASAAVTFELCPEISPPLDLWQSSILQVFEGLLTDRGDSETGGDPVATVRAKIESFVAQNRARILPSKTLLTRASRTLESDRMALPPEEAIAQEDALRRRSTLLEPIGQIVDAQREGTPDEKLVRVDIYSTVLTAFVAKEGQSLGTLSRRLVEEGFFEPDPTTKGQRGNTRRSTTSGIQARAYRVVLNAAVRPASPGKGGQSRQPAEPSASPDEAAENGNERADGMPTVAGTTVRSDGAEVPEGTYKARAISMFVGKSPKKETPGVTVLFHITQEGAHKGQLVEWTGYLTQKARERTTESLVLCGYDGTDPETVKRNEVLVVVVHEPIPNATPPKKRSKVAWVNDPARQRAATTGGAPAGPAGS